VDGATLTMENILIADDEPAIRQTIRYALEAVGFAVDEAEDGHAAMRKIQARVPDLVILDVLMPNQEGFETLRKIKPLYPGVKFLMMTGGGSKGYFNFLDIARDLGADQTLRKPFTREELFHAVVQCLPSRRS
jgi:DNA-binding response OmpR family regulator